MRTPHQTAFCSLPATPSMAPMPAPGAATAFYWDGDYDDASFRAAAYASL